MSNSNSKEVMDLMANAIRNPQSMVRIALDKLEDITNGVVIPVEASNPFTYSLEVGVTAAATALTKSESLARRLYPVMAQNENDLYLHMADPDYLNRFGSPATTIMGFILSMPEVMGRSVPLTDGTGARQLVIPKHTAITVGDTTFTMQYPIVIKILFNGTLSVYQDMSVESPVYKPITNDLNWSTSQAEHNDWLLIEVPIQQMKITSQIMQVTSFSGFSKSFTFNDKFYYARAYIKSAVTRQWVEISTTHNQQIYNPNRPTVCLKVLNQSLKVYIPQIYFANQLIQDAIRLDIYTTKGPMTVDMSAYEVANFKIKFQDLDYAELPAESVPLQSFNALGAMTRTIVDGGTNPLSFIELQRRVVSRSQYTAGLPVTTNQLGSALKDHGFDIATTLDNITERQYSATRQVEPPKDSTTVTGLGCTVQLVELTIDELATDASILDNNVRVTIPPETLLESVNGYISIVPQTELAELRNLALTAPDGLANLVNNRQFYFTPYHYVLDTTNNNFSVRPYHLTAPSIETRYVLQQNDGLGLDLRSKHYGINLKADGTGFELLLEMEPNASVVAFHPNLLTMQLSFTAPRSRKRSYVSGEFIGEIGADGKVVANRYLYRFDLNTRFDIDANHQLYLSDSGFPVDLLHEFDVTMIVKDYQPRDSGIGDIDKIVSVDYINDYQYTSSYIAATQERVAIRFGYYLEHLWRRSRTVVEAIDYIRYEEDIPAVYTQDIYERDSNGNIRISYDYETSTMQTFKLYSKGDPILNVDGDPVILHHKGDFILNNSGEPIPAVGERGLARQVDLFLVDGRYFFASNEDTVNYLAESINTITRWITQDIKHLSQRLLERTDLYYYPKTSVGLIDIIVGDGTMVRMKADQSLTVTYTLRKEKYNNAEIRDSLRRKTPSTINSALQSLQKVTGGAITLNDIKMAIKRVFAEDIIDVKIQGFLDDLYTAVLVTDVSSVPAIGKKLVTLSNLTLQVQDDVTVEFDILDSTYNGRYTERKER